MIILNGKEKEFEGEVTVEDFIRQQNYKKEQVAVEINEKISICRLILIELRTSHDFLSEKKKWSLGMDTIIV